MSSEMTEVGISAVERRKKVNFYDILQQMINQVCIFLTLVEYS
jgi:hypothetical protein